MWRGGNTRGVAVWRGGVASSAGAALGVAIGLAAALGPGAGLAWGQGGQPGGAPGGASAEAELTAPLVDWSHAERAHRLVSRWLDEAGRADAEARGESALEAVSAEPVLEPGSLMVSGAVGVRVTLRIAGIEVGWGEAFREDFDAAVGAVGPAVDLGRLLREATDDALQGVRRSLGDAQLAAVMSGEQVRLGPPTLSSVSRRLIVGVQVGHRAESAAVAPGAGPGAVLGLFAPGYHGLRLSGPEGRSAVMWPATALARNIAPRSQLVQLLDAVGLRPDAVERVARLGGPGLVRFEVLHVVRPAIDLPADRLVRGGLVMPVQGMGTRTLDGMAQRLAAHLRQRFTDRGLVRGTYHPTSDRYDPAVAGPTDTALASYALVRFSLQRGRTATADARIRSDAQQAVGAVRALFDRAGGADRAGVAELALGLIVLCDAPAEGVTPAERDRVGRALLGRREASGWFTEPGGERVSSATAALATAGLSAWHDAGRDAGVGEAAAGSWEAVWSRDGGPNMTSLIWLLRAAERPWAGPGLGPIDAERAEAIRSLVSRLVSKQVVGEPALGPADVQGGFELGATPPGGPPSPDWRTAQALELLALVMRDPQITPLSERLSWLLASSLGARFIGQLTFDEPNGYYVRSRSDALGGVRLALWDNRLPIAPTAVSLSAASELLETLSVLQAMYAPPPEKEDAPDADSVDGAAPEAAEPGAESR